MRNFQRTARTTFALWQIFLCFLWYIVTCHLLFMARLTEVSRSPAEPLSDRAAESALEFNKVGSMYLAIFDASSYRYSWAFSTHQFFWLEIRTLLSSFTILLTTKVWHLAFEAHVVRELVYRIATQVVEEFIIRIFESWVFIDSFEFGPFYDFLEYIIFYDFRLIEFFYEGWTMRRINLLLALRTLQVAEYYTRTWPSVLHFC